MPGLDEFVASNATIKGSSPKIDVYAFKNGNRGARRLLEFEANGSGA